MGPPSNLAICSSKSPFRKIRKKLLLGISLRTLRNRLREYRAAGHGDFDADPMIPPSEGSDQAGIADHP
jgi:hypothetical protein